MAKGLGCPAGPDPLCKFIGERLPIPGRDLLVDAAIAKDPDLSFQKRDEDENPGAVLGAIQPLLVEGDQRPFAHGLGLTPRPCKGEL